MTTPYPVPPSATPEQVRQWSIILHLSQYAGFIIPFANLIAPIVIWQIKKDQMPELDIHGKRIVNWQISMLIYMAVSLVLSLILIGFLMMAILGILWLVFPLIGTIKASNGELWHYPLTIKFF